MLASDNYPLGVLTVNASAAVSGGYLVGRVCTSSARIACGALLSCSCASGPVFSSLKVIVKKQKGD